MVSPISTHEFCFTQVRGSDRSWPPTWDRIRDHGVPRLEARGITVWGAFYGLFGIGSTDVVLMTQRASADARPDGALEGCVIVAQHRLVATVRPAVPARRLGRPGLYVFRFFDVATADVNEVVRLSNEAWTTFESTDRYAAEPQGLFAPLDPSEERGRMLLLTWYDGFTSWETSRSPAPAARENFQRRQRLTQGTIAYATRLIGAD